MFFILQIFYPAHAEKIRFKIWSWGEEVSLGLKNVVPNIVSEEVKEEEVAEDGGLDSHGIEVEVDSEKRTTGETHRATYVDHVMSLMDEIFKRKTFSSSNDETASVVHDIGSPDHNKRAKIHYSKNFHRPVHLDLQLLKGKLPDDPSRKKAKKVKPVYDHVQGTINVKKLWTEDNALDDPSLPSRNNPPAPTLDTFDHAESRKMRSNYKKDFLKVVSLIGKESAIDGT
jgi:hypothetical protein